MLSQGPAILLVCFAFSSGFLFGCFWTARKGDDAE